MTTRKKVDGRRSLVVVESPAKAKTINKFLGKDFAVRACMGHVRDLPQRELGIDIADGFKPKYQIIKGREKVLAELKKEAKVSDRVLLATDPDREGEAIAWHVAQVISKKGDGVYRITFNQITQSAVSEALENPLGLDLRKVNAQQARRVLDRLVGYKVSPVLWKAMYRGLSAGRVQSVALRMVCEREEEISCFVIEEYWSITAKLKGKDTFPFNAKLIRKGESDADISNGEEAEEIVKELKDSVFKVLDVRKGQQKRNPPPPFITSTLQQDAATTLRFSSDRTMRVAQELYEGIELEGESVGLITYMRTDSVRVAPEAVSEAREYIASAWGGDYVPMNARSYKVKKGAQDAHEAIRPTSVKTDIKSAKRFLTPDQTKLYELIWKRFVASQMKSAILDVISVDIGAVDYIFRASGSSVKYSGFTVIYTEGKDEDGEEREDERVPENLKVGEELNLLGLFPQQHFTKPPPRYTEASLVKELEAKGIGRPSTYADITSKIKSRSYVKEDRRKFVATDLGMDVNTLLVGAFPDIFDVKFTAMMEDELDRIEEGEVNWVEVVDKFYTSFEETLSDVKERRKEIKESLQEKSGVKCDLCGREMVIKWGRNGKFMACPGYPECKNTKPLEEEEIEAVGRKCEKCGGNMVTRSGRYGKFLACSNYPECKNTKPFTLGIACQQDSCGGELLERKTGKGRMFYGCSNYPECKFASWDRPVSQRCPACGADFMVEKTSQKKGDFLKCLNCQGEFPVG